MLCKILRKKKNNMFEFVQNNIGWFFLGYVAVKAIVRTTRTKKDDAVFGPIENFILSFWFKIPNRKKGGGIH